jgi:cytidylate kinase
VDEPALNQAIEKGEIQVSFQLDPQTNLPLACLNGEVVENEIRTLEVSNNVSFVSALPFVREFLTQQQKNMGKKKGIVMDGRDIGTAVFPKAELKIFLTASPEVRAQRRFDELVAKGDKDVKFEEVLKNVQERDYLDTHREIAPLRQADDAIVIDNSHLTKDEQNALLLQYFKQAVEK